MQNIRMYSLKKCTFFPEGFILFTYPFHALLQDLRISVATLPWFLPDFFKFKIFHRLNNDLDMFFNS